MAAQRSKKNSSYARGDWKHFVKFGALLVAVAGTLILGAVLQTDDVEIDGSPPIGFVEFVESPEDPAIADDGLALEPAGVWDEEADDDDPETAADAYERPDDPVAPPGSLARRAESDLQRMEAASGWTLQFLMACEPANVRPALDALGREDEFFLLPTSFDGRACYRICWGVFASREAAVRPRALPAALLEITDTPQPVPVEQAVR